jgi:NADH:ubiquinone oxidoreductase subunit F (NADH-binding)
MRLLTGQGHGLVPDCGGDVVDSLDAYTLPRLLPTAGREDIAAHRRRFGPTPGAGKERTTADDLVAEVTASRLLGRGGAGFPTARKLAAVMEAVRESGRRPVVVVNAMEGEPASLKDRVLLQRAPHLVIDGAQAAAGALGATEVFLCLAQTDPAHAASFLGDAAAQSLRAALREREGESEDGSFQEVPVTIARPPERYVSGESSALANWLGGGPALPTFSRRRIAESGVSGAPTLLDNAETFAHLALIARFGAAWFAGVGTPDDPGSALVTVSGAVSDPGVAELPLGATVRDALAAAGGSRGTLQAILLGGYGGRWVPIGPESTTPLSQRGPGAMGPGIVIALPTDSCGLAETARVTRFMAEQGAGQCGPCAFGLPALAGALEELAWPMSARRADDATRRLARWTTQIAGRGACGHPDGVVRLVRSAMTTFGDDLDRHRRGRPCAHCDRPPLLPVPEPGSGSGSDPLPTAHEFAPAP